MKMPQAVRPYAGRQPLIEDPWLDICYRTARDNCAAYYTKPTDADVAINDHQMLVNAKTAAYLYSGFTPTRTSVKPGRYKKLQAVVDKLIGNGHGPSDRDKVLKLLAWCRDIAQRGRKTKVYIAGGDEELIAQQGGDMCNENSRVLLVMTQIAGFASRYVGQFMAFLPDASLSYEEGHASVEIFLEGSWAFFDIEGRYFPWPNGRLASYWELVSNPGLYTNQGESVRSMLGHWYGEGWNHRLPLCRWPHVQMIANYDDAVRSMMTYTPVAQNPAAQKKCSAKVRESIDKARAQLRPLLAEYRNRMH